MKRTGQAWLWVLGSGVVLFVAALLVVRQGGQRFFPAFVLLGAMVVPATVVTLLGGYERRIDTGLHRTAPTGSILWTFLAGGLIGVVAAALIEFATLRSLGIPQLFGVGLTEETVKLIFPIILFLRGKYRSDMDGLLFGVASGMGFAALETVGYGFSAYLQSHGNLGAVEQTLIFRGLFSPAGHAAWTGLVCSMLWHERNRAGHATLDFPILGALALAIVLHASWDIVSSISGLPLAALVACYLIIAAIGLSLIGHRMYRWHFAPGGSGSPAA
jgi:protease PrsW